MRPPIGGECVTSNGSKLNNSLGRTELANSLGKKTTLNRTLKPIRPDVKKPLKSGNVSH